MLRFIAYFCDNDNENDDDGHNNNKIGFPSVSGETKCGPSTESLDY